MGLEEFFVALVCKGYFGTEEGTELERLAHDLPPGSVVYYYEPEEEALVIVDETYEEEAREVLSEICESVRKYRIKLV